ncbi:MAG: hypothetical protein JKY48_10605 [Flavobacteriales bacterium]|nr:hypothetical protein [Flavobacteriales bacterium]
MIQDKDHILLDNYIEGVLSFDEREKLENRFKDEPELDLFYQEQLALIQGIQRAGKNEMSQLLKKVESELPPIYVADKGRVITLEEEKKPKQWIYIAGSIAAVFILVLFVLFSSPSSTKELYAVYFEPYPNIVSSEQRGSKEMVKDAMHFYDLGDYATAIDLFEKEEALSQLERFYLANTYLANNQTEDGINTLKRLKGELPVIENQISWYLALAYIKMDLIPEAEKELKMIIESDNSYQKKANKILNEID